MHFIYYINRSKCHENRFNLFGLLTNSTQRIYMSCGVVRGGRDLVTFRSQSRTLSLYTTHVDKDTHVRSIHCSNNLDINFLPVNDF